MSGKQLPTKHIEEPKLCGVVVTQLPEDGAKEQADAHSEEESHSIVLWRPAAQHCLADWALAIGHSSLRSVLHRMVHIVHCQLQRLAEADAVASCIERF